MTDYDIRATLAVQCEETSLNRLCELIGLEPDFKYIRGTKIRPNLPHVHRYNAWVIRDERHGGVESVSESVAALLARFPFGRDTPPHRLASAQVALSICVIGPSDNVEVRISAALLSEVAAVGGSIFIDAYCASDENDEMG